MIQRSATDSCGWRWPFCIPSSQTPRCSLLSIPRRSRVTLTTDGPTLGSSLHQSPNSQLKMSLLNNLIQMQGLGNSVAQQQVTGSMSQSTLSSSPSSSSNQGCSSTTNTAPASSSSPLRIPRTTRRFSSSRSSFLSCSSF